MPERERTYPPVHTCIVIGACLYNHMLLECADINSNSFTGHSQCARHCAKCLVNIVSHKCEVCVDSYSQTHWLTARSLEHRNS